jgi:serine/threonine protein kinase
MAWGVLASGGREVVMRLRDLAASRPRPGGKGRRRPQVADAAVPGYRELAKIGEGPLAIVYRAVEEDTGRPLAIKLLKPDGVPDELHQVVMEGIRAQAVLSGHPNVVILYRALSASDGRTALVLELCRESLARKLHREGRLPIPESISIAVKIAGAIESSYRHGFLHGGVDPGTVWVTRFGEPALGDFATAALRLSSYTAASALSSDLRADLRAAPEILEGHPPSSAVDIYGLGQTLYELLTGHAPFVAFEGEAPASVILRILRDRPEPILPGRVPRALADLLESSLAKDPALRPSSAACFAEALRDVEMACSWQPTPFVAWASASPLPNADGESTPAPARGPAPWDALAPGQVPAAALPLPGDAGRAGDSVAEPRGPSVAVPTPAPRKVITPPAGSRGVPCQPLERRTASDARLEDPLEASAQPLFVDPPGGDETPAVVEGAPQATPAHDWRPPSPLAPRAAQEVASRYDAWVVMVAALAGAVAVIAVLLMAGII